MSKYKYTHDYVIIYYLVKAHTYKIHFNQISLLQDNHDGQPKAQEKSSSKCQHTK